MFGCSYVGIGCCCGRNLILGCEVPSEGPGRWSQPVYLEMTPIAQQQPNVSLHLYTVNQYPCETNLPQISRPDGGAGFFLNRMVLLILDGTDTVVLVLWFWHWYRMVLLILLK